MANAPSEEKKAPKRTLRDKSFNEIVVENSRRIRKTGPVDEEGNPEDHEELMKEKEIKGEKETPEVKEELKEEPKEKLDEKVKEVREKREKEALDERAAKLAKEAVSETFKEREEAERRKQEEEDKAKPKERQPYSWEKEGKTPQSYERLGDEIEERAVKRAEELFNAKMEQRAKEESERQKQQEQQTEEQKKQQEEFNKRVAETVDAEVAELRSLGKLGTEKEDLEDFAKFAQEFNAKRISEGKTALYPLALANYYKAPEKQPAGENAPVMGNKPPAEETSEEGLGMSYADFRRLTPRQIMDLGLKRVGLRK